MSSDTMGSQENISVIGVRNSGQTTIANLLAEYHAAQQKRVEVRVLAAPPRSRSFAGGTIVYRRRGTGLPGSPVADVVIHDGYLPDVATPNLRIITCSSIYP